MSDQKQAVGALLEVSVQILNFEPGLYRMSYTSQRGDQAASGNGFPWAKLEVPPGAKPGQSIIAVQGESGWLARTGDAALVQVAGERAPLLLTIYQVPGANVPPEFKVQRLDVQAAPAVQRELPVTLAPAAASPDGLAGAAGTATLISGLAHVQGRDIVGGADGWIGVPGGGMPLEGFALSFAGSPNAGVGSVGVGDVGVEYSATLGPDWSTPWARDGAFCGSRGLALPLLGLAARLVGAGAENLDLRGLVRFVGGREIGPISIGDVCAAPDSAPIEAFRLIVTPADREVATASPRAGKTKPAAAPPRVSKLRKSNKRA
jgi:hypothetical protein